MKSSGYLHVQYAKSFAEIGTPLYLSHSRGWIIKRAIPHTAFSDGMGCYPLFSCQRWDKLSQDLTSLQNELISLSLVLDPFGKYSLTDLDLSFDVFEPYKEHFVVDLLQDPVEFVSKHHKRNVEKSLSVVDVSLCSYPENDCLDEWTALYSNLSVRHNIKGVSAFSRNAFSLQMKTPGIVIFQAKVNSQIVGMSLWYVQGDIAYYHLAAYSFVGYQVNASFAMFWKVIEYFADMNINWLALGSGAGVEGKNDGLTRFKQGWSTGTRTAYFCGKIFNPKKYQELTNQHESASFGYFPAYRIGEFVE